MRVEKADEFRDWIDGLSGLAGRARILGRVDRPIHGDPGDHRKLAEGVSQLRVDVGPGYSACCSKRGDRLMLLLAGGDESSQPKDIAIAARLIRDFGE